MELVTIYLIRSPVEHETLTARSEEEVFFKDSSTSGLSVITGRFVNASPRIWL